MDEALTRWLIVARDERDLPSLEDWIGRPAWMRDALCTGETRLFFSTTDGDVERARKACRQCPVRQQCYSYAMADSSLVGVWGGFTEGERREIRRRRVA